MKAFLTDNECIYYLGQSVKIIVKIIVKQKKIVKQKNLLQPIKDDCIINAEKNKLDKLDEGSPQKKKLVPFAEVGDFIDCNDHANDVGELSKKIYR